MDLRKVEEELQKEWDSVQALQQTTDPTHDLNIRMTRIYCLYALGEIRFHIMQASGDIG